MPVIDGADLCAEDLVQNLGDGVGEGGGEHHEEFGDPDGFGANCQRIAGADGLNMVGSYQISQQVSHMFQTGLTGTFYMY